MSLDKQRTSLARLCRREGICEGCGSYTKLCQDSERDNLGEVSFGVQMLMRRADGMKKTGILTFHYSNNYGGVLQSYALYNFVKSINENTEIINFVPSTHNRFLQSIYVLRDSLSHAHFDGH